MDLEEYDYLGNFNEFDYDNVESVMKSLAPTEDLGNDSQDYQSDKEIRDAKSNKSKVDKEIEDKFNCPVKKDKTKKKKKSPKTKTPGRITRSISKDKTKNDDSYNDSNDSDNDDSSEDEINNLFAILDKPSNSANSFAVKERSRSDHMAKITKSMPNKELLDLIQYNNTNKAPPSSVSRSARTTTISRRRDPNVVVIGSDDEYENLNLPPITIDLRNFNKNHGDFESKNPELKIKIEWRGKIEKLLLRKFQKFNDLMKLLADREKCNITDILLNLDSVIISSEDTPDSIKYKISDIISKHSIGSRIVVQGRIVKNSNSDRIQRQKNSDELIVKIQTSSWKQPIEISISKNDTVSIIYIKVAEEIKSETDKFTLIFDGEILNNNSKIEDLELEGGELIEIIFKK